MRRCRDASSLVLHTASLLTVLLLAAGPAAAQGAGGFTALLGGSGRDLVFDTATDPAGNVYVVGETWSADFPIVGGVQGTLRGTADAFVAKLSPDGQRLLFSTFLGGTGFDSARGIAVDTAGNAYVTGYTDSFDFPLKNPLDANRGGFSDAFIVKLNPQGSEILFSTYLGGGSEDNAEAIALDVERNVYVVGRTRSDSFFALNAAQPIFGGGEDAFVAKLNASLTSYAFVTYLGGSQLEVGNDISVDAAGRACVAGQTVSANLPVVNAPQPARGGTAGDTDGFFAVLNAAGTAFEVTSYLGGASFDAAKGVACNGSRLAVVGETRSLDFPTGATVGADVQSVHGGETDGFLAVFNVASPPTITRELSTFIGGRRADRLVDVAITAGGDVSVFGDTASSGLPEVGGTPSGLTGTGIFKSLDAGVTWTPSGLQGIGINDFARADSTPRRLLAATDLGLHVSADEGATWTRSTTGYAARVVHTVAVHPTAPCTWVIGVDSAASDGATPVGAARTTDCGSTWDPWGFAALRFKQLHWLGDPTRLVVAVDRPEVFDQGSQQDTCVTDQDGTRVRCLGTDSSDDVIAVDPSDTCRWIEGNAFGSVWQMSGNAFGCDHPFNFTDLGVVGSGVTALAITRMADGRLAYAGTQDGIMLSKSLAVVPSGPWNEPTDRPDSIDYIAAGGGTFRVFAWSGPSVIGVTPTGEVNEQTANTGAARATKAIVDGPFLLAAFNGADMRIEKRNALDLKVGLSYTRGTTCDDEATAAWLDATRDYLVYRLKETCSLANRATFYGEGFARENMAVTLEPSGTPPPGDFIENPTSRFPSSGGVGVINIRTSWGLTTAEVHPDDANHVEILRQASPDQGIVFAVDDNATATPRVLRIIVTDQNTGTQQTHVITVDGAGSAVVTDVSPREISAPAAGGAWNVSVTAPEGQPFNITDNDLFWLEMAGYLSPVSQSVAGGASGTESRAGAGARSNEGLSMTVNGPGVLRVDVQPNAGPGRVATIDVGGVGVTVIQAAADVAIADRSFLAEGATSDFFDTVVSVANPSPTFAVVATATFDTAQGQSFQESRLVHPLGRATFEPKAVAGLEAAEFSTSVTADGALVAARVMSWDATGYGSHAEAGIAAPVTTWYLAEGATHSGFELFYLLQNPGATDAVVDVRYLRPAPLPPLEKSHVVAARSRFNIWVNQEGPDLSGTDVSAILTSTNGVPFTVERAMYLSSQGRFFNAGHDSAGIPAPAPQWFLAEGATGPFFDLFQLIANPNPQDAPVAVRYLLPDGSFIDKAHVVPANSRYNIWVDLEDARLADTAVSTTITSTDGVPIVVERAMWWAGGPAAWHEAHNSAGATATGTRWAVASGEVGGEAATETYVLIANTSPFAGQARVTLLFEGGDAPVSRVFALAPTSRTNVPIGLEFPESAGKRFGVLVESLGDTPAQLVVEQAIYSNSGGVVWAAGANLLATRLP